MTRDADAPDAPWWTRRYPRWFRALMLAAAAAFLFLLVGSFAWGPAFIEATSAVRVALIASVWSGAVLMTASMWAADKRTRARRARGGR